MLLLQSHTPPTQIAVPWKPHLGQKKGVKFLLSHESAALFADPGTGKTSCVLDTFRRLLKTGEATRLLIIAPLKVCHLVWPAEQRKWTQFSGLSVAVLHGKDKEKALFSGANVCVINPDGLDWLFGSKSFTTKAGKKAVRVDVKGFSALGFDVLCVDELTAFKHNSSLRFKALKQIAPTFKKRWGLTGTPVPNGLIDLFGQMYVLDLGESLGQYVTHYRTKYFTPNPDQPYKWDLKPDAEKQIYERIRPHVLRLAAEDYVDMPRIVDDVIKFDLPDKVREIYGVLEDDLIVKLEQGLVIAANDAVASNKLHQICNGGIYLSQDVIALLKSGVGEGGFKRETLHLHDEKTDLLEALVNELQGSPLLVAYEFNHDLERLQKRFGKDLPIIGGGTTPQRLREVEAAFNRGIIPLLAVHPGAAGHGINLQGASNHVAWYSQTWDYELDDQLTDRVRRQGNKHSTVFVHRFIARNTVDERIFAAVRKKEEVQTALLDALKGRRRKRDA